MPQYETTTVQDGWTTITRNVPNMVRVREQVGSRTYYEKIPKFKTVTVQDGWRWVSRRVPTYRTMRYVRYYTTRSRRVPTPWCWRTVRQRVPVYAWVEKQDGYRTVEKRVPRMIEKKTQVGTKVAWELVNEPRESEEPANSAGNDSVANIVTPEAEAGGQTRVHSWSCG